MGQNMWIDVSVTLKSEMLHWPGDPPVLIERVRDMDQGDTVNLSKITMGAHSGTHIDAPIHFLNDKTGTNEIPLDYMIGSCRVLDIKSPDSITRKELEKHKPRQGERILLRTLNSEKRLLQLNTFFEDFLGVGADAADYLVSKNIRTIGIDYLSIGGYKKDGHEVHRKILEAGILIIEGLDLSDVIPGRYDLMCLPIKIYRCDGAPARVILKKIDYRYSPIE